MFNVLTADLPASDKLSLSQVKINSIYDIDSVIACWKVCGVGSIVELWYDKMTTGQEYSLSLLSPQFSLTLPLLHGNK